MKIFSLLLLVFTIQVDAKTKKKPPAKIAIVGSGVGGSSSAYFLREKFGEDVQIDLFEKNDVLCGRVATADVGGVEYETGGVLNFPNSRHMKSFKKKFGFEAVSRHPTQRLGIFDGSDYVYYPSNYWIIDFFRKLWTFGLDFFRINWSIGDFLTKFESIYDRQDRDECFDDLRGLIHAMGGDDFVEKTQLDTYETFAKLGVRRYVVENWISPVFRGFCGQSAGANGFVGSMIAVANQVAGSTPVFWSMKGGNKQVCYKLVEHSSTNVIHEEVQRVGFDKNAKNEKFSILTKQSPTTPRRYDIVVVSTPIGSDMSHIDVSEACSDNIKCPSVKSGLQYTRYVANIVKGKLNSTLFQCNSWQECPTMIAVPDGKVTFYWSLILVIAADFDAAKDKYIPHYAAFTPAPLTDDQLSYLFESYSDTTVVDWMAFPRYTPPEELGSFVLNEAGLYYTSPSEWAASLMEVSIISGKNAALLAYKNWYSIPGQKKSEKKTGKVEL